MESHSELTQLSGNETPRQLSHCQIIKKFECWRIQDKIKDAQKPNYLAYMRMFDQCKKTEQKISLKCTFKGTVARDF
jgi:hypothetical protein